GRSASFPRQAEGLSLMRSTDGTGARRSTLGRRLRHRRAVCKVRRHRQAPVDATGSRRLDHAASRTAQSGGRVLALALGCHGEPDADSSAGSIASAAAREWPQKIPKKTGGYWPALAAERLISGRTRRYWTLLDLIHWHAKLPA